MLLFLNNTGIFFLWNQFFTKKRKKRKMASNNNKWWRYQKSFNDEDRSFFKKSLETNLIEFILQKKTQKNHSGNFTKKQNKMLCGNFTKKLLKNILMFLGNLMAFFILLRIILEEKILMQIPPSSLEYYDFIKSLILASFLGSFSANFFIYFFLDDNMRQFDEKNAETNTREKYWRDNERVCVC